VTLAKHVGVVGLTDHPHDFAAGPDRAGVAFADLRHGPPRWCTRRDGRLVVELGPDLRPSGREGS
jgi:poly-gamma-glutamate synthesis protein (capsule biosynthesis protein)